MPMVNLPINFVKVTIRSKQALLLAVMFVTATALIWTVPNYISRRPSAYSVNPAKKEQQGCCSNLPAIPRRMIGTYYTTEDGFQSTLILNNKGLNQIMVTPILHSQNGQTFAASPVAVGGHSAPEVDLNTMASIAGQQFRSGSFEFTYEGRMLEVGGGLRIVNAEKSLIFDEQMLEPGMKFPSARLEAVYALPFEDSRVSVIVTNTSAQPILVNGDAIFVGANGHHPIQSQLGPYQTQVVDLPHGLVKKASAGAVSLNHNGGKGALLAKIHLQDADRGYSEAVNFANPGGKTTERHGTGLRLGSVNNDPLKPVTAVRNIGDSATIVTATVPYSKQNGDTGTISLPQVSLAPGEIKLLNTSNSQLRRNDFDTAGLEIKYTGAPGSVIASATSVSQSGNQVFAVPMKDPKGGLSSTGGYPWFIEETSSTVVFIKNVTNEPQEFILNIFYPGGRWGLKSSSLAPNQTLAVDVRKLRDTQEKGVEGNAIPPDATSGHVSWGVLGGKDKVLIGRAQTVDFNKGLAATYECQCLCSYAYSNSMMTPANVTLNPGDIQDFTIASFYYDCFGYQLCLNETNFYGAEYSSGDPNVATFEYPIRVTAIGPGTAGVTVTFPRYGISNGCEGQDPSSGQCNCTNYPVDAYAGTVITVNCTIPEGENTSPGEWDLTGTRKDWFMILKPHLSKWAGRKIYELGEKPANEIPDSTDKCWFQGSDYPAFKTVTNPPDKFWTVRTTNEWGPDNIGYPSQAVKYYRGFTNPPKVPCGTRFLQKMYINCDTEKRYYAQSTIGADIGTDTVSSTSAGLTETRNWL